MCQPPSSAERSRAPNLLTPPSFTLAVESRAEGGRPYAPALQPRGGSGRVFCSLFSAVPPGSWGRGRWGGDRALPRLHFVSLNLFSLL